MTVSILHIDDDPNAQKLVDCFLRMRFGTNYSFTCADSLAAALERLDESAYDSVLIDNRLAPYQNAGETVPAIAERSGDATLYVVSASTAEPDFAGMSHLPIAAIIDKFDLKQRIAEGLLG